jgi:hypothetical protein
MNNSYSEWYAWFSGFVDGEGYFQICPNKQRSGNCYFSPTLTISLRETDKDVLYEIETNLDCGHIYYITSERDWKRGVKACNQFRWKVSKKDDLLNKIVPLFDRFPLRTKKRFDYIIWKEALLNKSNGEFLWRKMKELHSSPFDDFGYRSYLNKSQGGL